MESALGPTASVLQRSDKVGVIAVRQEGGPEALYHRIKHRIPPDLVDDFIIMSIDDEDVVGKRRDLCALARWAKSSPEELDPDAMFDLPRSRRHRRHRHRGRRPA